ncbi:hypothetical protein [Kibdelosporangium philippinense]|uniref:hypothetical protein n=1 Tax=Kibdelosporangium philippinense TaxID=211113 RepID=UPI00360D228B
MGSTASFVQLGVPIGVVLANTVFLLAVQVTGSGFASWGWRIPFLVGIFVLVLAWFIHTGLRRRGNSLPRRQRGLRGAAGSPLGVILRKHLGTVLLAGGSFAVNTATFYILLTGAPRQLASMIPSGSLPTQLSAPAESSCTSLSFGSCGMYATDWAPA